MNYSRTPNNEPKSKENKIVRIFNYLGGALIFIGIIYFIGSNWSALNDFLKLFSTVGSAIAAFIVGILLQLSKKYEASSVFFMIAALVLPIGLGVTFVVNHIYWSDDTINLIIAAICLGVFLVSQYYSPQTLFLLFLIIYASSFFISFTNIISHQTNVIWSNLTQYELIALGLSYLFYGYYLEGEQNQNGELVGPLYFFGALLILFNSYILGSQFFLGYAVTGWQIITGILILLSFIFSVPMRSKSLLYWGAIFLVLYLCDISAKFAHLLGDMGWSLMLVITGFVFMLIGYLIYFIHRKIASPGPRRV